MIKGVIFGLAGVIVDIDEMNYKAWKQVADRMGVYFDKDINHRIRGFSRMKSLDIILEMSQPIPETEKIAFADKKNDIFRKAVMSLSAKDVDGDVMAVLCMLRDHGVKCAIGSTSKNVELMIKQLGIESYFDAISDGNSISGENLDSEIFLKAAALIGVEPSDCAVVENISIGIDAANAGGFYSIGIGDAAEYDKTDMKIKRLTEILNLL